MWYSQCLACSKYSKNICGLNKGAFVIKRCRKMFENMKKVANIFYPFVECYNLWHEGPKEKKSPLLWSFLNKIWPRDPGRNSPQSYAFKVYVGTFPSPPIFLLTKTGTGMGGGGVEIQNRLQGRLIKMVSWLDMIEGKAEGSRSQVKKENEENLTFFFKDMKRYNEEGADQLFFTTVEYRTNIKRDTL